MMDIIAKALKCQIAVVEAILENTVSSGSARSLESGKLRAHIANLKRQRKAVLANDQLAAPVRKKGRME